MNFKTLKKASQASSKKSTPSNSLKKIDSIKSSLKRINIKQLNIKKINLRITGVIILMILMISLTLTTYAALSTNKTVLSAGGVNVTANLGVYSDSAFQNNLTSINWGSPTPGTNVTKTIYIKNTGSGVSLALSMVPTGWVPTTANGPITLTWDQEGTRLLPGQSTAAVLTLVVSPNVVDITNFTVSISISGTQ
ncbi:MAG TPA: hypothetical protein VLU95_00505 [Candidatus Acidoferrum sp.]|nr:hypothetical protein [Candidatus Acidoferrum sp.]